MKAEIKTILFAADFLSNSHLALDYAVSFARFFDAELIMVHALELIYPADEIEVLTHGKSLSHKRVQMRMDDLAERLRLRGCRVAAHVQMGDPFDIILNSAKNYSADLLVLGTHGVHRGLSHLLLGSNTEKVLLSSPCPAMTIGAHVPASPNLDLDFREILYYTDFSADAEAAAPFVSFLGAAFKSPIDICEFPGALRNDDRSEEELYRNTVQSLESASPSSDIRIRELGLCLTEDDPVEALLERARQHRAGLIVLGVHPESSVWRHTHTSVLYQLLAGASCPVISVPRRPTVEQ